MSLKSIKFWAISLLIAGITILQTVSPAVRAEQADSPAADTVQAAWDLAKEATAYTYQSRVAQTTYPAPAIQNIGRAPRVDLFDIDGQYDQVNQQMNLDMVNQNDERIEIVVDGSEAKGRTSTDAEWQDFGTLNDFFIPGGDPLGFLAGATNIQPVPPTETDRTNTDPSSAFRLQPSAFSFDFSGAAFGRFVTDALTRQLIANGELQPDAHLEISDSYAKMAGSGQIWIDEAGYPVQIQLDLDLGTQESGEQITAQLDYNYAEFQAVVSNPTAVWFTPSQWASAATAAAQASPELPNQIAIGLATLLFSVAAILIVLHIWTTRYFYNAVAGSITVLMLAGPFLQVGSAHAYHGRLAPRLETAEAQSSEDIAGDMLAQHNDNTVWYPQQNPLTGERDSAAAPEITIERDSLAQTSNTVSADVDTDGDGVIDSLEDTLELCSGPSGTYCTGVTDSTDSDGDGLSDGVEVNQLGTFGDRPDSDNDGIKDALEVGGFLDSTNQRWYLDPNEQDTNKDGLTDAQECPVFVETDTNYSASGACPDTDSNGIPDPFDHDNDGDGVPDGRDLSPFSGQTGFNKANPFKLAVNNLATDQPVLVSLQIRPTNADHLHYVGNVLDWPSPDVTGQIQRRFNTTFANTSNISLRDTQSFNAGYGDIRIAPLLEVQMPAATDHYANLPVLATAPADRPSTYTVTQWLDTSKLEPYGITVMDSGNTGQLTAYVPLSIDTDATGGGRVALTGQSVYYPSQGTAGVANWGAAHEFRLIWMVQMLTETCTNPADNNTCTETIQIIHIYDDEFSVSGLNIREEHGTKVAVMYEDPANDSNRQMEDSLWEASYNLSNTFLRGRDCATIVNGNCTIDNTRDVAIENIGTYIDSFISPTQPVSTTLFTYEHSGFVTHVMMTETNKILNDKFMPYASQMNPTILFAQEQDFRAFNLDGMSFSANQITADMSTTNAPRRITGGLSWGPFTYDSTASAWTSMDHQQYVSGLENRLSQMSYFQPTDTSAGAKYEATGKIRLMQAYYLSLFHGLTSILEVDGVPAWGPSQFLPEINYGSPHPNATFVGASFTAYYTLEGFARTFQSVLNGQKFISSFLKEMGRAYGSLANGQLNSVRQWSTMSNAKKAFVVSSNIAAGVAAMASFVGIIIFATAFLSGDAKLMNIAVVILNATTVITASLIIISNVYYIMSLRTASSLGNVAKMSNMLASGPVNALTAVGYILQFAIIWGLFAYTVRNSRPGTVQYDLALANAIAQTVVALIFLAIGGLVYGFFLLIAVAAPGAGTILVMLIFLIDAIVYLVTYFLSEVFGIGRPFSFIQELTKAIAEAIYDVDLVIPSLDPTNRIALSPSVGLLDERAGFTFGNTAIITMNVTNTIGYNGAVGFAKADDSVFTYNLDRTNAPSPNYHDSLTAGSMAANWQNLGGNQMRTTSVVSAAIPFVDMGRGRDRTLDGSLYLIESFLVQYNGCWQYPGGESCKYYDVKNAIPLNVGSSQIFDVLPDTLTEFRGMGWIGTNTSPDQTSATYWPIPQDFDNDQVHVSLDVNDNAWDADGDGLGDYFERANALNPGDADSDGDGLLDGDEIREGTDPKKWDTDGDGLNDYVETIEGWLISYDGGQTRVWSNPLAADIDNDKLNDLEEYTFGFNPYVHTDPALIETLIQFDDFEVNENQAPVVYLPFDEATTTESFTDLSGNGHFGSCDRANGMCPTTGSDGRFGQAARFDGANDRVTIPDSADLDLNQFTMALWLNPSAINGDWSPIITKEDNNGANRNYGLFLTPTENKVHFNMASNNCTTYMSDTAQDLNSPQALTSNVWQHLAITYDGSNAYMYLDGVEIDSGAFATTALCHNAHDLLLGDEVSVFASYNGLMDEVFVLNHALTAGEVGQLMNGRYNLNDDVMLPGDTFTYQTTVTNTNGTRSANGILVAESTYVTPDMPQPEQVFNFDADQLVRVYSNLAGNGGTLSCVPTAQQCPTVTAGTATFDGVNDQYTLSSIAIPTGTYRWGIEFQVYVPPMTSGERRYLMDTISTADGALDIYVEYRDANGPRFVATFANQASANIEFSVDYNTWATVKITAGPGGVLYSDVNGLVGSHGSVPTTPLIGEALIGNNVAGTEPFNNQMAFMRVFHDYDYNAFGIFSAESMNVSFDQYIEQYNNSLNGSNLEQSQATCDNNNCPTNTAGKFGEAVQFDNNVNTKLTLDPVDLSGDFAIAGWYYLGLSEAGTLLSSFDDLADGTNNPGVIMVVVNLSGAQEIWARVGTNSQAPTAIAPITGAQWNHIAYVRTGNNTELYINGVLATSTSGTIPTDLTAEQIRLGTTNYGTDGFPGLIDDFIIFESSLDATQVAQLAAGTYPAVEINEGYVNFTAAANTAVTPASTGAIPTDAPAGAHRFDQTADVAFDTSIAAIVNDPLPAANLQTHHPFEEIPGFTGTFQKLGNGAHSFRCTNAQDCPTTGLVGRNGRALYFDGKNDQLTLGPSNQMEDFSYSAWVKPESGTIWGYHRISSSSVNPAFTLEQRLERHQLMISVGEDGFRSDGLTCPPTTYTLPYTLAQNEWSFVTVVFDFGTAVNYYVNGQLAVSQPVHSCQALPYYLETLGDSGLGNDKYKGYIDEFRSYNTVLTAADVQTLYEQSAPIMHFQFDEDGQETTFVDSANPQQIGTPSVQSVVISGTTSTVLNPTPGTDGKIGNIATFNEQGMITLSNNPAHPISSLSNDFTVMAWIKPDHLSPTADWRTIITAETNNSANGFSFGTYYEKLAFYIFNSSTSHESTGTLNQGVWQHVAVTFDSNNDATFYLNGVSIGTSLGASAVAVNTDEPYTIGGRMFGTVPGQLFDGGIDELIVMPYALTTGEISNHYLRDLRWYRDRGSELLTIDTDNPTISLVTSQTYFSNTFTMLAVETFDPTSNVALLDFGIKGPSDSTFSWQGAPACNDGAAGRTWCPSFNPALIGGAGQYQVQFRAVDQVGNETTSSITNLYIDTAAPTATSNHTGEWGTLTAIAGRDNSWTVPLSGTISDPEITTGIAGSGVSTSTVLIGLRGADGRLLSNNRQLATVSGTTWSITFNILTEQPVGTYTIELQAADAVGNALAADVGTIGLDSQAPAGTVDLNASPQIIAAGVVTPIQGTATDANGQGTQSVEVKLTEQSSSNNGVNGVNGLNGLLAATGNWEQVTLNGTDWSYNAPTNVDGFYELQLRTTDVAGNTAEKGTQWRGIIDDINPVIVSNATQFWAGSAQKTTFAITFSDFALNLNTSVHPCGAEAVVNSTYTDPNYPNNGEVYQIVINCTVDGHVASQSITACDLVGNCVSQPASATTIYHVTVDGSGNCSNWANACGLQTALTTAASGDEIWVASGIYTPGLNVTDTFSLVNGAFMFGGFAGTETARDARDYTNNLTILSGDIHSDDIKTATGVVTQTANIVGSNSRSVVTADGVDAQTALDGFTITGGSENVGIGGAGLKISNDSRARFQNLTFSGNAAASFGGAVYSDNSRPIFRQITVTNNTAGNIGGGMYFTVSYIDISDVVFTGNSSGADAGALYQQGGPITLTNASFVGNTAARDGGAIIRGSNATPETFNNISLVGNTAGNIGGGIMMALGSPTFDNLVVTGNSAGNIGGGIYIASGSPTFTSPSITSNSAITKGGGIFISSGSPIFNSPTITSNSANSQGGGIFISSGSPVFNSPTITSNSANSQGGGIFASSGAPTFNNPLVTGNSTGGQGGGVYVSTGTPVFHNLSATGNSADNQGGGLYLADNSTTLNAATIGGNKATNEGGGVAIGAGSHTIVNSIIAENQASGITGTLAANLHNSASTATFSYSLVEQSGGSSSWNSTAGIDGGNNLGGSPVFLAAVAASVAPTTTGNYQLSLSSPAIDSGSTTEFTSRTSLTTDVSGASRFLESSIDMGAYEWACTTALSTLYLNHAATGTNSGDSWQNAYTSLNELDQFIRSLGCTLATPIEIWVAQGVYRNTSSNSLEAGLLIANTGNLKLYGGFNGTETMLSQRDPMQNITVFSGDRDNNDIANSSGVITNTAAITGTNSPKVVLVNNASDIVIDGFTITGGNETSTSTGAGLAINNTQGITLHQLTLVGNLGYLGSGLFLGNIQNGSLSNLSIKGNSAPAGLAGGVYFNTATNISMVNSLIAGNQASYVGGMWVDKSAGITLTNLTVTENRSNVQASVGLYGTESTMTVENSLIWGNRTTSSVAHLALHNLSYNAFAGGSMSIRNSVVEFSGGSGAGWPLSSLGIADGGGNLDFDPQFTSPVGYAAAPTITGNYSLQATSPISNTGDTAVYTATTSVATDLAGNMRVVGTSIAMGAYEEAAGPFTPTYTTSGADLLVAWAGIGALCQYNLYESATPYSSSSTPTYTDINSGQMISNRIGSSANYFFKLQADCNGVMVDSAEVGVFNFALSPGQ